MTELYRAYGAELIGTFAFVTIGAGSVILTTAYGQQLGLLSVAFAHGLVLSVMITIFGRFSGGHFNPAVTVGVWVGGKIDTAKALGYVVSQLVGATLAGLLLLLFFLREQWGATNLGTPSLAADVSPGRGLLIEAVLTFFLVLAVWGTSVDPKGEKVAGFAVGLTYFVDLLVGGPITGGAMNPARALGPAAAAGFFENHWVYWAGPVAGAALGGLVYRTFFYDDDEDAREVPETETSATADEFGDPPPAT